MNFDATVAGYAVSLQMTREFVEDEIGDNADAQMLDDYFRDNAKGIKKAAWAFAYDHSCRGKTPDDPPGPVPYISVVTAPFDMIRFRE